MIRDAEKADWMNVRRVAYMWRCGDEICDCWQPRIEDIHPNLEAGFPWIKRKTIWAGRFCSQPEGFEIDDMAEELKKNAESYGAKIE